MAEDYKFIDIAASGPGIVTAAFDNQVAYCTAANAPVTARIVAAVADVVQTAHVATDGNYPPVPPARPVPGDH